MKNEKRKEKMSERSRWESGRTQETSAPFFFFFLGGCYLQPRFKKVKSQQQVSYSRVFEKHDYRSPKKEAYMGSLRIFGWCYLQPRFSKTQLQVAFLKFIQPGPMAAFFKNAAISPLSKTRTWDASEFFWCYLQPHFLKNVTIGPTVYIF